MQPSHGLNGSLIYRHTSLNEITSDFEKFDAKILYQGISAGILHFLQCFNFFPHEIIPRIRCVQG